MGLMSRFSSALCRAAKASSNPIIKKIPPNSLFFSKSMCSSASPIAKKVEHRVVMEELMKCSSIEEQMLALTSLLHLSPEDIQQRQNIASSVKTMLNPFFEDVRVQIFGSTTNGLGLKGCDIDMSFNTSVDLENQRAPSYDDSEIPSIKEVLSGKISKAFMSHMSTKDQLIFIHGVFLDYFTHSAIAPLFINAYVPIIRFNYDIYELKIDLSTGNRSALINTKVLKLCCELDDRVIPFLSTIRYWAKNAGLVGGGLMFNSYCLTLMALYYLQQRGVIPTVEYIMKLTPDDNWKSWWNHCQESDYLSIIDKIPPSTNTEKLENLLRGFFFYYLGFDFNQVICPLNGTSISRELFSSAEYSKRFRFNTICVQDPIKLTHNVANLVDYKHCRKFAFEMYFACDLWQEKKLRLPNSEKWGLVALFDNPANLFTTPNTDNIIEITMPLNYADESSCRNTAHSILHIFKHILLFECNTIQETDSSDLEMPDNKSRKLLMNFLCIGNTNTWLGRSNIMWNDVRPETFDNPLDYEREISLRLCEKNKDSERKCDFRYTCKFFACKHHDETLLYLTMMSKTPVTRVLGVFLREFIPKTLQKMHTTTDGKYQNVMNSM